MFLLVAPLIELFLILRLPLTRRVMKLPIELRLC